MQNDYMWITPEATLADLELARRDKSVSCLYLIHLNFTQQLIDAMLELVDRKFKSIYLFMCHGELEALTAALLRNNMVVDLRYLGVIWRNEEREHHHFNGHLQHNHDDFMDTSAAGHINQNYEITSTAKEVVTDTFGLSQNNTIKKILFQGISHFPDSFLSALSCGLANNTSIESILLKESDMTESNARTLANGIESNRFIQQLCIDCCRLDQSKMLILLDSVRHHPTLAKLTLPISKVDPCFVSLLEKSLVNDQLRSVNLLMNQTSDVLSHDLRSMKLPQNHSYKLTFFRNDFLIGQNLMTDLCVALDTNPAIHEVEFRSNCHSKDGLIVLSCNLANMSALKRLIIDGAVDIDIANLFVQGIQKNRSIECLELSQDTEHCMQINHYCDLNKIGRKTLQENELMLPHGLWAIILERSQQLHYSESPQENNKRRANVLFHLLHGPALYNMKNNSCHY